MVFNKRFKISERTNLEFRTEIFNVLNHTNFDVPGSRLNLALPTLTANGAAPNNTYTLGGGLQPGQAYTQSAAGGSFGLLTRTVERTVGLGANRVTTVIAKTGT